jgi:GT2 family glycosyltransferase
MNSKSGERNETARQVLPMANPATSCIIPHYATLEFLQKTIESLAANTPGVNDGTVEIIVVDGGSSPDVREFLCRMPITSILLQHNAGFTKHINYGLRIARGEHIVLLNSDVEVSPGWLEALQEPLSDPTVGIVGPKICDMVDRNQIVFGGAVGPALHKLGFVDEGQFNQLSYDEDYLTFCCALIRRDLFRQIGELDEQFIMLCSDSDFCYRAREASYKLVYQPGAVIYHEGEASRRKMHGIPVYDAAENQDLERFQNKWQSKLNPPQTSPSPAPPCESALPEAAPTSPNTSPETSAPAG